MELHRMHKTSQHSHLGEEKHQMLNLNRRLETYLSRVKLLEEENALLAKEIQALRRSSHGASTRRKCLEEELRQARLEVDAAWRDRVLTELEVGRLTEELQTLDVQRQMEAQAQLKAKMKLEQSRRELEEEQRAQIWLREKVSQLEHEMRHLIQTHQEDVAHLEAKLTQARATVPPALAQRGNHTPNLLQLGQEYSQRTTRAWQEAAEAYQGQLARLEESLNQTKSRLTQVGQEKSESQLRLQALEKEIVSAQDVRLHLEKTVAQRGQKHSQEIQQLQEHLEGLEAEKAELGQQVDHLLLENRGLLQVKMSLGLEVATYRALLDSESLRGDISLLNQPRNIHITDAVFSPRGVKKNYQTQLCAGHKTTSPSSACGVTGTGPTAITAPPVRSVKPVTFTKTPKASIKPDREDATKSAAWETAYPKIVQDGAVENFRPQEVCEKVTYAEPLSPPDEQEALAETSEDKGGDGDWSNAGAEPHVERPGAESPVSYQAEFGLCIEPPSSGEVRQFTTPELTSDHDRMTQETCSFPGGSDKDVAFDTPAEKEDTQEPRAPVDAWLDKDKKAKEESVQEETSDSETEAVIEPDFESRTSSPVSEYEHEESGFNKESDFSGDENISKEVRQVELRQEISGAIVGTNEMDVEEKLYPDGEEMDTWDSVIERKVDLKTEDGVEKHEEKRQHAEPEEDISTREQEREIRQDFATDTQQNHQVTETQRDGEELHVTSDQQPEQLPDNEEDDEEEDSQNVSVSWRTELESDSYAQDNTLADTRPLIRYKSDETDGNTQASHVDESESSEGEQEKKIGEAGPGTWDEDKSKRFGTMEDLCEEEEALDEEYHLGYTHTEDNAEEMIREVSEGHLDEETEEVIKAAVPSNVDFEEELETDRLVEQELENLATDSYRAHFTQQQDCESEKLLHPQRKPIEEMTEEEEAAKPEDTPSCVKPELRANPELTPSTTITEQPHDKLCFSELSVTDTPADEEVQHEDREAPEKREEEDEHNVSTVTHADVTEDHSGFRDLEEINSSVLQLTADQKTLLDVAEMKEAAPVEASSVSQEHLIEEAAVCREVPETAEWEVLENPNEDFEIRDQNEAYDECNNVPESTEKDLHHDGGVWTHGEDLRESCPGSVPDENDIFVVKDSAEVLNTNGKDTSLQGFFSSGVKNDFWVSSLETGATYQPDDASNEPAEQTNQSLGFADNLVWGDLENPNANWKSSVDTDYSEAVVIKEEQEQMLSGVKQVLSRNVAEGELVHSEESEAEAESWSSGEEVV
uniref:nestin n=1 Tax=Scatophagus argus TaxID=75038 RepID=UPI001ED826AB|nr:nestin [Scatophagus argus]